MLQQKNNLMFFLFKITITKKNVDKFVFQFETINYDSSKYKNNCSRF